MCADFLFAVFLAFFTVDVIESRSASHGFFKGLGRMMPSATFEMNPFWMFNPNQNG
ncbi:hypothetical protein OESDEN_10128 [Oesophagostomum dentatum]|uniref:Uncharacterized protein n=1 Tax=Oesophagostomum dentatum TaxID=61180 RepID=A0A0B1T2M6_OESDE|nr:hypothetical protein OESDEN_10128 [Oesophagostomum dentatum]